MRRAEFHQGKIPQRLSHALFGYPLTCVGAIVTLARAFLMPGLEPPRIGKPFHSQS